MGIGTIGSTQSFWQQDQNYWNQQQSEDSSLSATNSVISAMSSAETSLGKGLASIANSTALKRVNTELTSDIQNILSGNSSAPTTTSPSSSSSDSAATPATATGTASLSVDTSLASLGILAGGSITISAGGNTTAYASTGSDTVGDLLTAINFQLPTNAAVKASLNSFGQLVVTARDDTDTVTIGGVYASNIGFAVGNQTFKPTQGSGSSTASASPTTSSSTTTSSTSSSGTSSKSTAAVSTVAQETASSAASLLSDSGVAGSVVDMLA
jgi:hypothetical protein